MRDAGGEACADSAWASYQHSGQGVHTVHPKYSAGHDTLTSVS